MNKMGALDIFKKIASLALVACFLLPLSQCAQKGPAEAQPTTTVRTAMQGVDLLQAGRDDLEAGRVAHGLAMLLAVFNVFFLPAACLGLPERLQAAICLIASLGAAWWLYVWVFMFTQPQIGGLIAAACWAVLLSTSSFTLFRLWRSGRLFKRRAARAG